ncbi:hypothetical protein MSAN_00519500 [Mycena sanguinolenta]|uniref:MYND-type domain-containing protein n=1 Tax=Mycena sanguinolenta TaxID=230812 RepID=A0A8H6Z972_9AGAR|nr:hypothetical protein MSAN_00519500 [Mycena sanguinolenta]
MSAAPIDLSTFHPDEIIYHCISPALDPETIRNRRKGHVSFCWVCLKTDTDVGRTLRRCGKCHLLSYCSKECQKKHWPEHKQECGKDDVPKFIPKLVKTLLANPLLCLQLQSCFVLAFDLIHRARRDEMLLAQLDVAVEPSNLTDFADIFLGQGSPKKEVPGMLQLNKFVPAKDVGSLSDLDPHVRHMHGFWRSEFALAESEGVYPCAVGMLAVSHPESELSFTVPLRILPSRRDFAHIWISGGLLFPSGVPGETIRVPYTVENCLQYINAHIRADTANQMLLRAVMRPFDIQLIRNAGMNFSPLAATVLAKMEREHVYKALWETYLERLKAAADRFRASGYKNGGGDWFLPP